MIIVGTRPEAIKMAPLICEFQSREKDFELTVVNTAQHREMVDQVFSIYNIRPDIDLDIMEENQTLVSLFSKGAKALQRVFSVEKPAILLIEGDTSTAFVASLMAFYNRVDVAHVEAGLRTCDIYNPFPEEVNRRITSVMSKIHFAPTQWAKNNLLREGYSEQSIFITGNPVIDALLRALETEPTFDDQRLNAVREKTSRLILVTAHRRENHGEPLKRICEAILHLLETHKDLTFVYPVHPNPNVQRLVKEMLSNRDRIFLVPPLDYLSFVHLMKSSYLILTDSGGIQEEAPTLGKPVLVLREKTERPEAIQAGTARVIGTNKQKIVDEVDSLLEDADRYKKMTVTTNPFGDGKASKRIAEIILSFYSPLAI